MSKAYQESFMSPLGLMRVCASNHAVESIHFVEALENITSYKNKSGGIGVCERIESDGANAITARTVDQLIEYFNGSRLVFDLPLGARGTEFQQNVWNALTHIPYGETCSYGDIAKEINKPKAMRAVGLANGRNPLTIVVPFIELLVLTEN